LKGIADTGFLVAFANVNDKHHRWAAQLARMADRFSEQKPDIAVPDLSTKQARGSPSAVSAGALTV